MLSSFLRSSPDSIVFLVRELALCRHFLIRPLVMFMYKQHIPVGETGVQSWIRAQPCSWKVRGRWKEGGERKRMNRNMIRGLMTHNIWMGGRGEEERGVTVRVVKRYHGKKRGSRGRIQCQIQICRFSWMEKKEITGQKQSRPPRRRCGCYTKRHQKKYKSSRVKKKKERVSSVGEVRRFQEGKVGGRPDSGNFCIPPHSLWSSSATPGSTGKREDKLT